MRGPLAGLRVLDLTRLLPGAFATSILADLGADVIKVEAPDTGDPMRGYEPKIGRDSAFHWVSNRNKRSIVVDLRAPQGAEVVLRLAAVSDVLIESFRPGVADRLGVGEDAVLTRNPNVVYCSLNGYGSDGPLAHQAGHDIDYAGRAGVVNLTGVDGRPVIPGVPLADLSGSLLALVGILAAIVGRHASGAGNRVDVSLSDAAFALQTLNLAAYFATGDVPGPGTEMLTGRLPCYQLYRCGDGRWLAVGALERPFWLNLCNAVGRNDLEDTQNDPSAVEVWQELFATRTRPEWLALLQDADACCGPVNDLAEAIDDPQLSHREMVLRQNHPIAGSHPQVGFPIKLRTQPASLYAPAPGLGEHTRAVLLEAGFTAEEVAVLVDAGVIRMTTA